MCTMQTKKLTKDLQDEKDVVCLCFPEVKSYNILYTINLEIFVRKIFVGTTPYHGDVR